MPFVLNPLNVPVMVARGGSDSSIATVAYETPDALSPVPANTLFGIALTALATPCFGKSTAAIERFGAHQSALPPAPSVTSPSHVSVVMTPFLVPPSKSACVVCVQVMLDRRVI